LDEPVCIGDQGTSNFIFAIVAVRRIDNIRKLAKEIVFYGIKIQSAEISKSHQTHILILVSA